LSIIKVLLKKITHTLNALFDDVNINTAFKVAWVEFLRLRKIIYTNVDRKRVSFDRVKITRDDVSFVENNQYATLRLKRSKIDLNHTRVQIILAVTSESTCSMTVLRHLFRIDSQSVNVSLFRLEIIFIKSIVIVILRKRLIKIKIKESSYSDHSFRRETIQHAVDHDMLNENIQKLSRWTLNAFQLYFQTSFESLFNLNLNFQTRVLLTISRAIINNK
jgi:hypothetical protein